MDQTNKKKFKFGFIDIIIILIALLIIGGIIFLIVSSSNTDLSNEKYYNVEYTLKITNVNSKYLYCLQSNAKVYNSATREEIGTITSSGVKYVKTTISSGKEDINNQSGVIEYEDLYDCYITIRTNNATMDKNGFYYLSNQKLTIGSEIYFSSNMFNRVAYCTDMKVR